MVSNNLLHYNIQDTIMNTTIKHPRMVNPGAPQLFIRQNTEPGGIEVHTTDAVIEVDTYEARASMGLGQLKDADMVKHFAEKGKQSISEFTKRSVHKGDEVVKNRTTPVELARREYIQKHLPKEVGVAFYPSEPAEVDVHKGTTDISFDPTVVNIDWEDTQIVPYELDRGTVSFDIVQKAYVDIMYMGDPNYFPEMKMLGRA